MEVHASTPNKVLCPLQKGHWEWFHIKANASTMQKHIAVVECYVRVAKRKLDIIKHGTGPHLAR
jgi:hypothetical protein